MRYEEMAALLDEVKHELKGHPLTHLFATAPRMFVLTFARHLRLVICCDRKQERFHLAGHAYPNHNTPFARSLEDALIGAELRDVVLAQNDRILELQFPLHRLIAELIPAKANLLLVGADDSIQAALVPQTAMRYKPPDAPSYTPSSVPPLTSKEVEQRADFQATSLHAHNTSKRQVKSLKQRVRKLQARLQEAQGWECLFHEAELLQANFAQLKKGMTSIKLEDWAQKGQSVTIELQPDLAPKEQVAGRFKKARSFKLGVSHLKEQLAIREQELAQAQATQEQIEAATTLEELPPDLRTPDMAAPPKKEAAPFRRYEARDGTEIFVGRTALENDRLTFHFARGSDWWLHAHNVPGAHVVLRVRRGTTPSREALHDALQIATHHSRACGKTAVEITVTQVKWLKRPKGGRPGKVWVSQHKVITVRPDLARIKSLQSSSMRSRNR